MPVDEGASQTYGTPGQAAQQQLDQKQWQWAQWHAYLASATQNAKQAQPAEAPQESEFAKWTRETIMTRKKRITFGITYGLIAAGVIVAVSSLFIGVWTDRDISLVWKLFITGFFVGLIGLFTTILATNLEPWKWNWKNE